MARASTRVNPKTGLRFDFEEQQRLKKAAAGPSDAEIKKSLALLKRQRMILSAREDLMAFTKFTMPDPADPGDVEKSSYEAAQFHIEVAHALEAVERGEIQQLIFAMPPRHGKTQLATKSFAAWLSGRHPTWNLAVASYSDTMAEDMGADTRAIMASQQFKQVFPEHALRRGGTAKANIQTDKGGRAVFVGRGGALTGRGADCFPAGTLVATDRGDVSIEALRSCVGQRKILSFDKSTNRLSYENLQAFAERPGARLYRLTTASGGVVEATGDHPFWVGGRYVEMRSISPGDSILRALRNETCAQTGRVPKRGTLERTLLQPCVLSRQDRAPARPEDESAARGGRPESLRGVQRGVHAETDRDGARDDNLLLSNLRECSALRPNGQTREPALERQRQQTAAATTRVEGLPHSAAVSAGTGRAQMHSLRGGTAETAGGAPQRRQPAQQYCGELGDFVQQVPSHGARCDGWELQNDEVISVEDTGHDTVVYDIQVARNHNFFANGVGVSNCLLIDDLYKDHEEARSQTIRDQAWNWFTKVAMTRRMGRKLVIITMTRWHSDDIIGRITDPENPCYNAIEAAKWKIIRLPAIAEEEDPLGRAEGTVLWPERFDLDFMQSQQRLDPLGFAALYQQRPTVADGVLFRRENMQFYKAADLPDDLRIYCSSDHAVATGQRNDYTVMFKIGVDRQSNIWVLDCFRAKVSADKAVEAMLAMASGKQKPLLWWAERGHISKSIGPFLRKRMLETGTYINVVEVTPVQDKEQRAQSIAARIAMGKVYFPTDKVWTEKIINELLAFPSGIHDDAVDALAYIGLGLQSQFAPGRNTAMSKQNAQPKTGTLAWMKMADKWAAEKKAALSAGGF